MRHSRSSSRASMRRRRLRSRLAASLSRASSAFCWASLLQPPLLAAARRTHLHPGAAQVGQVAGERVGRPDVGRDDDQRRDAGRAAVVLEAEGLEELRDVLPGLVLEVEGVPVDQPAAAEREDLHGGGPAAGGDPDHVHGADRALVGGLALGQVADRGEPVAVAGGLLELLPLGGLRIFLQLAQDRPRLAGEELDHRRRRSRGSPPSSRSRRRAPGSGRCGSRGRGSRSAGRAAAPRTAGRGRRGSARRASRAPSSPTRTGRSRR